MPGLKAELSCRAKAVPLGVGQHLSSAQEGKSLQVLTGGSECLCQENLIQLRLMQVCGQEEQRS